MASRLIGVVRDRLLASTFGAGTTLDAYYAAFKVPDFIFNTFVLGALASAFIPVFVRLREGSGRESAIALAQRVLISICIFLAVASLVAAIFAPQLMSLVAPGFDQVTFVLSVKLSRIMLFTLVFFGVSSVIGSVLQAERRFLSYAIAPVLYNIGILLGIYLFVPWLGNAGLAWGVVLGSAFHALVQIPSLIKHGFAWQRSADWHSVKEVGKLMLPRTLGLGAQQLNQIVTVSFVSHLAVGSLAAYTFAVNLYSFPISVVGVSLAVAAFPVFSQALSSQDRTGFSNEFGSGVRRVLFFTVPLAVLFLVERAQIVRVILGSGSFDWTATIRTAQVLGFLALAMVADSLIPLAARAFYAARDTITPVVASIISIVVNVVFLILLKPYGLVGIGMAYVAASLINLMVLLALLGKSLDETVVHSINKYLLPVLTASLAAGACAYAVLRFLANIVNMQTFVGIFIQGVTAGLVGTACYLTLAVTFKLPEVNLIRKWWRSLKEFFPR